MKRLHLRGLLARADDRDDARPQTVARAGIVERRHTLPILANVLVEQKDGRLFMTATDLEMQITAHSELAGKQDQSITVAARKLQDLLRALPDDATLNVDTSASKMTVRARSRGPRLIPLWPRATSERGGQSYTGVASSAPPAEPGPGSHFGGSRPAGRPLQVVREQKSRPNCGALPQIAGVEIDHSIEQRIPAFDPIAGSPIPPSFFTGTQCATASAGVTALFLVGSGLNVRAARRAVASLRYAV